MPKIDINLGFLKKIKGDKRVKMNIVQATKRTLKSKDLIKTDIYTDEMLTFSL